MNEKILSSTQSEALREIKSRVMARFDAKDFLLYGSVARGEAEYEYGDIDAMVSG